MKIYLLIISLFLFTACQVNKTETEVTVNAQPEILNNHHIEEITKVFDAHGGYDNWAKHKSLRYQMGDSKTLVDLQHRYTLVESENQKVGFDGANVWVMPPNENADRQRMRYNLMFYFYAFPFVVGDPGVNYEVLPPRELEGTIYNALKISYNDGIGDSPNDNYIILSDTETDQMQWLLYTATFGSSEPKDQFSLIKYDGWEMRSGVLMPSSLQWYQYQEGRVGDPRGPARRFSEVQLTEEHPPISNFKAPEGAHIIEN